jgi:putative phosphoesterase
MRPVDSVHVVRVGLIGDVHGAESALSLALSFLEAQSGLDAILCTGDLPSREGAALAATVACCQMLAAAKAVTIRGNHDRWHVESKLEYYPKDVAAFLSALPPSQRFVTPLGEVLLCHGIGDDDMNGIYRETGRAHRDQWLHEIGLQKLSWFVQSTSYRLLLCGHTHLRLAEQHGEAFLINAGTLLADKETPTVSIIDFAAGWVRFYALDLVAENVALIEEMALPSEKT